MAARLAAAKRRSAVGGIVVAGDGSGEARPRLAAWRRVPGGEAAGQSRDITSREKSPANRHFSSTPVANMSS